MYVEVGLFDSLIILGRISCQKEVKIWPEFQQSEIRALVLGRNPRSTYVTYYVNESKKSPPINPPAARSKDSKSLLLKLLL